MSSIHAPELLAETTLNELVARYPQVLPVLQRVGLDTCCGGALPLRVAAEHHALDLDQLVGALREAIEDQPA